MIDLTSIIEARTNPERRASEYGKPIPDAIGAATLALLPAWAALLCQLAAQLGERLAILAVGVRVGGPTDRPQGAFVVHNSAWNRGAYLPRAASKTALVAAGITLESVDSGMRCTVNEADKNHCAVSADNATMNAIHLATEPERSRLIRATARAAARLIVTCGVNDGHAQCGDIGRKLVAALDAADVASAAIDETIAAIDAAPVPAPDAPVKPTAKPTRKPTRKPTARK